MKKIILIALTLLLVVALVGGCSKAYDQYEPAPTYAPNQGSNDGGGYDLGDSEIPPVVFNPSNRKILYSINVEMNVDDFSGSISSLYALLAADETSGNWIKSSQVNSGSSYQTATFTLSIKTDKVNQFLLSLGGLGRVVSSSSTSQDITTSYAQKEAELLSLQQEKEIYTDLLIQQSVINNYSLYTQYVRKVSELNKSIALLTDTISKYDSDLDYSTLVLIIRSYPANTVEEEVGFLAKWKNTFIGSLSALGTFFKGVILVITAVGPFVLCGGALTLLVLFTDKKVKQIKAKRKAQP